MLYITPCFYVRNYVRIMCHGGDPSKKVFHVLLLFMCYHDLFAHQLLRTAQAP